MDCWRLDDPEVDGRGEWRWEEGEAVAGKTVVLASATFALLTQYSRAAAGWPAQPRRLREIIAARCSWGRTPPYIDVGEDKVRQLQRSSERAASLVNS